MQKVPKLVPSQAGMSTLHFMETPIPGRNIA